MCAYTSIRLVHVCLANCACVYMCLYVWCMCVLQIVHVSTHLVHVSYVCVRRQSGDCDTQVASWLGNCLLHDVCAAMSLCGVAQATNVRICIYLVLHRLVEGFHGRS